MVGLFVLALTVGLLASPLIAETQPRGKVWRIGWLGTTPPTPQPRPFLDGFLDEMRGHGYIEGQNLSMESRYPLPGLDYTAAVAELLQMKVDVLFTANAKAALIAKQATSTIPIVFVTANPERVGLVASLARPGGNLTGVSIQGLEWGAKQFQLLKEAVPHLKRLVFLWNPDNPASASSIRETEQPAAHALGLTLIPIGVRDATELERAFEQVLRDRPDALGTHLAVMFPHRDRILRFAEQQRMPLLTGNRTFAEAGALMAFGTDYGHDFRRAAWYVARIFKWANPADLPVEQSTKFEFVVNIKPAKMLGLTIPPSLLLRASHVIQ